MPGDLEEAWARYPVISIVIPAHDEESTVAGAIERALAIRWPEIDVIVVDDGSTDGTREAVRPYVADGRARLLVKPVNEGKSLALNDALGLCRGELVLVLDADGQADPAVFEHMVPRFLRSPQPGRGHREPARPQHPHPADPAAGGRVRLHRRDPAARQRHLGPADDLLRPLHPPRPPGRGRRRRVRPRHGHGGHRPDLAPPARGLRGRLRAAGALRDAGARDGARLVAAAACAGCSASRRCSAATGAPCSRPRHWRMWPILAECILSLVWAHLVVFLTAVLGARRPARGGPARVRLGARALHLRRARRRRPPGPVRHLGGRRHRPGHQAPAPLGRLVPARLLGAVAPDRRPRDDPRPRAPAERRQHLERAADAPRASGLYHLERRPRRLV